MAPLSKATSILLAGFLLLGVVSCNTVKGAGKDVSATGEAVTDAAQTVQDEIKKP